VIVLAGAGAQHRAVHEPVALLSAGDLQRAWLHRGRRLRHRAVHRYDRHEQRRHDRLYANPRVWGRPTTAMWVYLLGPERAKRMQVPPALPKRCRRTLKSMVRSKKTDCAIGKLFLIPDAPLRHIDDAPRKHRQGSLGMAVAPLALSDITAADGEKSSNIPPATLKDPCPGCPSCRARQARGAALRVGFDACVRVSGRNRCNRFKCANDQYCSAPREPRKLVTARGDKPAYRGGVRHLHFSGKGVIRRDRD
jgi:hypothetical protein